MGGHDHPDVKHANAKTFFLGGLKRFEKATADKFRAHPALVVGHREHGPPVALAGSDTNFTSIAYPAPSVHHQVSYDFLNPFRVHQNARKRATVLDPPQFRY